MVWVNLHSFFSGGLRKTIFSARVRFGRSRSSKGIDFNTNGKRIPYATFYQSVMVTLALVLSCTVSEILQVFCSWPYPYFTLIWGVSVAPNHPCWGQPSRNRKLISREIVFEIFQPVSKS